MHNKAEIKRTEKADHHTDGTLWGTLELRKMISTFALLNSQFFSLRNLDNQPGGIIKNEIQM